MFVANETGSNFELEHGSDLDQQIAVAKMLGIPGVRLELDENGEITPRPMSSTEVTAYLRAHGSLGPARTADA